MKATTTASALVGVWPAAAARSRSRLLDAASQLVGVPLVPVDDLDGADRGLSGLIVLASSEEEDARRLRTELPALVLSGGDGPPSPGSISFTTSRHLDPRLRGGTVAGEWSPPGVRGLHQCEVLATAAKTPVWARSRERLHLEVVSVNAPELARGESLRDRVTPGKCLAMLALLQFLRSFGGHGWSPPAPHAAFIVDDPNLRWRSYGHIHFSEVVCHAALHNYHVSFATIPLDLQYVAPRTVRLFRSAPGRVSLTMHGNNHTRDELRSPASAQAADRLLAQAVGRTMRFEARTGLAVSRVMVPPHEACAAPVLMRLPKFGFEAVASKATWLADLARHGRYAAGGDPVAGFGPADVTDFGMPVLIRRDFCAHDEAILRRFLNQPIILCGHARDFRDGLGFLEAAARVINRVPGVVWSDMSTLARSCYVTRHSGDELQLASFARRLSMSVPAETRAIVVEPLVRDRREDDDLRRTHRGAPRDSIGQDSIYDRARSARARG